MKRLALILLLLCTPALAHDANHPELNSWFDHLSSGNGLCCAFVDGRAVADPDWDSKDGTRSGRSYAKMASRGR